MTPNEEEWQKIHDNGLQNRLPPKVWINWTKDNINVPGKYCVPIGKEPKGELFDFYWCRISQGREGDGGYQIPIPLFKIRKDMTKEDFDNLDDNWVKVQFSVDAPITIESPPVGCPHDDKTAAVFATSHYWQYMYVEIDMIKWGIEPSVMNFVRPTIKITQLCNARHDCGAQYQMIAYLMRPEEEFPKQFGCFNEIPTEWPRLKEFRKEWADGEGGKGWSKAEIVFDQYPVGCRKLGIKVCGKDTKRWKGEYGAKFGQIEVQVIMPDEIKFKKYEEFADPEKVPNWLLASNSDNSNPGITRSLSLNPSSEEFDGKVYSDITEEIIKRDKRDSEKIYRDIVEICKNLKMKFVDPDFPHSNKSIGDLRRHENEAILGQTPDNFKWLRPCQINTEEGRAFSWAVFRDPRPSDIEQGSLGDCWLVSAMALIAERPDILEQIVLTKHYSDIGVYQVRICADGEWCTVTVDDYFPCNAQSLSLAFVRGRNKQLWVPLIEKALAKHLGSYAKLRGGRTQEGLAMLTGAPCETISLEDENLDREMLWAQLISAHEASFIMGCSCGSGRRHADKDAYKSKGLQTRHAYSILDVRQEGQNRLVHIRNPWGSHVWTGDWSDHWPGWPQNLRQKLLSRENHGSGAFWMSFDDFISYFDSVDIAKIRTYVGWSEFRTPLLIGGHSKGEEEIFELIITEPTEINISLYQKGARTVDDQDDLMVSLHKLSATGKVSDLVARSGREICAFVSTGDIFLKPDQYVVICHSYMQLGTGDRTRATLAIHSSRLVYVGVLRSNPAMLGDSLIEMIMREGVTSDLGSGIIVRYVTRKFGGLIVMVDNTNSQQQAHIKLTCEDSRNVISSRSVLNVADVVRPLSRQILIILSQMEPTQRFSMTWNTRIHFSNERHLGDLAQPGFDGLVDRLASHTPNIHTNDTIQQLHLPRSHSS